MVKVLFSIFQFKFSVYSINFEISNPIEGFSQSFPRFLAYEIGNFRGFSKIFLAYEIGNFRGFSKIF